MSADELAKLRKNATILGFNLTAIVTVVLLYFLRGGLNFMGITDVIYAALLGTIGAVVGFLLAPKFGA